MSIQPIYSHRIARELDSQGTLLPPSDMDHPQGGEDACEPSVRAVQTLGGNDTRHDSQHPAVPDKAHPGAAAEPFGPIDHLGFLSPPLEDGELGWLAHYRVLRVLGAGGMGMVLEAEDTHLQRRVALKVIHPEMAGDVSLRQRFLREARAMAAIQNDRLVTIYQVGQDRDVPFLAMQYLQGETLQSRLGSKTRLPLSDVLRIGIEIAEGLEAVHAHHLIHRDIKPANIWLETVGSGQWAVGREENSSSLPAANCSLPTARVKLLDFGLAVTAGMDGQLTGLGRIVGTPLYMAPEQIRGQTVDQRCDLFSLGAVLYEIAAGVPPFQAGDPVAIYIAVATEEPRPLAESDPSLPATFTELVHRLLSKMPEDRPASARAVAAALRAIECGPAPAASIPRAPEPPVGSRQSEQKSRRGLFRLAGALAVFLALTVGLYLRPRPPGAAGQENEHTAAAPAGEPIRVGILHSLTGELAATESSVVDATLLAIEDLNEKGGVLGRPIEPVLADGCSDEETFAREATRLIVNEHVAAVFGCWTSACRKAVKPVFELHRHLLFYPVYYEGLESSGHIVYTGGTPNQQIIPAVQWSYAFLGKRRFFLVGTDSVYPRTVHAIVRDRVRLLGGKIVGEEYVAPGAINLSAVVRKIVATQPDLIVNSLNGGSNVIFVRSLRREGVTSERVPMLSFNISENVLRELGASELAGDYTVASYYPDLDRPESADFLRRLRAKFGPQRLATDPMESAYNGVHIWAKAVEAAGDMAPSAVAAAVGDLTLEGPGGSIRVDPDNRHVWAMVRLARIGANGRFEVVWTSDKPVRPEPYPATRTQTQWEAFLADLQVRWKGRWEASAD